MVNKAHCELLALVIEQQPHTKMSDRNGFQMQAHSHYCGTPSCISGWGYVMARSLAFDAQIDFLDAEHLDAVAKDWLGLNYYDGHKLFYPNVTGLWSSITPQDAAKVLRHLAATGEVNWDIVQLPPPAEEGR